MLNAARRLGEPLLRWLAPSASTQTDTREETAAYPGPRVSEEEDG